MQRALREGWHIVEFARPGERKGLPVGFLPMAVGHRFERGVMMLHRPDEPDAAFDLAVVEHDGGRGNLNGGAARSCVDQQLALAICEMGQRIFEQDRPITALLRDGQQPRLRARRRMRVDGIAICDDEALRSQRLQANVIDAAGDGALHFGVEQLLEGGEEDALKLDRQRQQAVQECGDRRQFVLDPVGVHQLQAGGGLEAFERAALDLAAHGQEIELAQRVARVGAFEIVLGTEQALSAGLALPARDRAQRVEPPGDGRKEALLGLHVGRDRPEQRRLRLIGAVGAAEALNGGVGLPSGFEQVVDPQALVPGRQVRVIAAPGAAGVGKDEDALGVIHEGGGFGEIGGWRTVLDGKAVALSDDAARAPGHLGHHVRPKALHDLVERAGHGRQRGEPLDQFIAAGDGLAAFDGLAIAEDGARREIALGVGEGLVELHREGMGEVIQHVFARRDVDANVVPFVGRDFREAALHQGFAGGNDLNDGGVALVEIALDGADQRRRLHRGQQMTEEPLLGRFKGRAGGGLGLPVQRALGAGDVGGFHRRVEMVVNDRERPGVGVIDAALLAGERMLDQFVFDAVVGERARSVEAERTQIARQHFHSGDAAVFDGLDEFGACGEGEILAAPEPEPLRVSEIVDGRRPRRRDIDDAGVGQRMLQAQAGAPLLRRGDITAFALAAAGVLHGMAFVEDDDPVEALCIPCLGRAAPRLLAQPFDDLPDARNLLSPIVGAQRGVGCK